MKNEKKIDLDLAIVFIGNVLEEADETFGLLTPIDNESWKRIKEVVKNSEEYKKEKESLLKTKKSK